MSSCFIKKIMFFTEMTIYIRRWMMRYYLLRWMRLMLLRHLLLGSKEL
jgi:hypothetical protein